MAKSALKRESEANMYGLPDTIGGAGGAIKMTAKDDIKRNRTQVQKKMCDC